MTYHKEGSACLSSTVRKKSYSTGSLFQEMYTRKHWKVQQ